MEDSVTVMNPNDEAWRQATVAARAMDPATFPLDETRLREAHALAGAMVTTAPEHLVPTGTSEQDAVAYLLGWAVYCAAHAWNTTLVGTPAVALLWWLGGTQEETLHALRSRRPGPIGAGQNVAPLVQRARVISRWHAVVGTDLAGLAADD